MPIIDELYDWCLANYAKYEAMGVAANGNPPFTHSDNIKVFNRDFTCRNNALQIFVWDVGHINADMYRGMDGEPSFEYCFANSGEEACEFLQSQLEMLVNLPPAARPIPDGVAETKPQTLRERGGEVD